MTRPSIPGSMAVKRRIAQWSADWQEAAEEAEAAWTSSADAPARQPLSLSTWEVVESLKQQWGNDYRTDPCTR